MKKSILIIVACLLLGGFVLTGCGSDDDSATTGNGSDTGAAATEGDGSEGGDGTTAVESSDVSRDEYITAAEELCKQRRVAIERKLSAVFKQQENGGSQQQLMSRFVNQAIVPGLETEADELRQLGAPEGEEERVEEIIDAIEAMVSEAKEDPEAFLTSPNDFKDANELAKEYGIPACGKVNR